MDTVLLMGIVFVAGTALLAASRQERFLLFFLIRTRHFLNLIDYIARLAPGLWKFLADMSVVVSFGGLGAAYLSRYRRFGRNLDGILFLMGLAAIMLWAGDLLMMLVLLVLLALALKYVSSLRNPAVDFFFASGLGALAFMRFVDIVLTSLGSGQTVPLYVSMIEGAFGIPVILLGLFLNSASLIVFEGSQQPGAAPILPTVTESGEVGLGVPGYPIFIPLVYAVISLIVVLVCHEFAHGVLARVHKIRLKSTGLLTLGILPIGAFVEPDEKELEGRPSIEKMRVFSAGLFANLLVCVAAVLSASLITALLVDFDGIYIVEVGVNSSANGVLSGGMVLNAINGLEVRDLEGYRMVMSGIEPGTSVVVGTSEGDYEVVTMPPSGEDTGSYLGITVRNNIKTGYGMDIGVINFVLTALTWILFFNFNIALVNVLPVAPFDGWRMLRELMDVFKISRETAKNVVYLIVSVSIFLLLVNMYPLLGMFFDYIAEKLFPM
ncbi:MAG: site-2 protease family protein [Candidatus Altiarchaeota archaeon]|nr:site-2 protease family protein [Candidatus Altiarchaeota archaeon]